MRLCKLARHAIRTAHTPGVTRQRLRPQAEGTQRRAPPGCIERDVGMQEEWHVVLFDLQVALIDLCSKRERIELPRLQRWPGRIVCDLAAMQIAGVQNLAYGLTVREVHDRMIKFAANDKVNIWT